jgi:hypothetical protein
MFDLDSPSIEATLKFYGTLKIVSQIISYVGIAATGSLSVFDLLYKQKSDPEEGETRYRLNKAGRTRLIAFLSVLLVTIGSTVMKDYADHKLDGMAHEKAQQELRAALGMTLDDFTKTTMKPSLDKIGDTIRAQSDTLHANIGDAVSSLNVALDDSRGEIERTTREISLDVETAQTPIAAYTLDVVVPEPVSAQQQKATLHRLKLWTDGYQENCKWNPDNKDEVRLNVCRQISNSIDLLKKSQGFIQRIDPSDTDPIDILVSTHEFTVQFRVHEGCDATAEIQHEQGVILTDENPGICMEVSPCHGPQW